MARIGRLLFSGILVCLAAHPSWSTLARPDWISQGNGPERGWADPVTAAAVHSQTRLAVLARAGGRAHGRPSRLAGGVRSGPSTHRAGPGPAPTVRGNRPLDPPHGSGHAVDSVGGPGRLGDARLRSCRHRHRRRGRCRRAPVTDRRSGTPLAVMPGQVVQPGDGRVAADRAVGAVVIVEVQPAG